MVGQDLLLGATQGGAHGGELGDDIDAITVVLDHAREAAHLALDPLQPLQHRTLGTRLHDGYIPLPGIRFKRLLRWTMPRTGGTPRRSMRPPRSIWSAGWRSIR